MDGQLGEKYMKHMYQKKECPQISQERQWNRKVRRRYEQSHKKYKWLINISEYLRLHLSSGETPIGFNFHLLDCQKLK